MLAGQAVREWHHFSVQQRFRSRLGHNAWVNSLMVAVECILAIRWSLEKWTFQSCDHQRLSSRLDAFVRARGCLSLEIYHIGKAPVSTNNEGFASLHMLPVVAHFVDCWRTYTQ